MSIGNREKNFLYFGVSTAIILALIYFADVQKFINSLESAKPLPLVAGIVFGTLVFAVFGFTWHRFFQKMSLDSSYLNSFKLFMSGQFMNSVTPLGQFGGEPVMAYIVKENQNTSYEKALSTVVSADIVNTVPYITFLICGSAYLLLFDSLNQTVSKTASITAVFAVLGSLLVYILWFEAELLERKLSNILSAVERFTGWEKIGGLHESLEEVRESLELIGEDPKHLAVTTLIAHLSFGFQAASLFFIASSVGETIGLVSIYFIIAVSSLANFSPTPGGSGTFEAAMAGILTVFTSIEFADALTISILYRLATYWSGIVLGYICLVSLRHGGTSEV